MANRRQDNTADNVMEQVVPLAGGRTSNGTVEAGKVIGGNARFACHTQPKPQAMCRNCGIKKSHMQAMHSYQYSEH